MTVYVTVSPVHGRDCKNPKSIQAAWDANVDFIHETRDFTGGGYYINKADAQRYFPRGAVITCRFDRMTKMVTVYKS